MKAIGIGAVMLAVFPAFAGAEGLAEVEKRVREAYPKTTIDSVEATPIDGLYKLGLGANVAFVDASGRYFVFGKMFDMQAQEELFQPAKAAKKIDFNTLPLDRAIKSVRGKGTRVVAVFSDPDCPYCKRLEGELAKLDDVTVYTFLMPLESIHPQAAAKSRSVWCAPDRDAAWKALMQKGIEPAAGKCDAPLAEIAALAESLGIQGTPFMIAESGASMPGAAPAARLDAWLKGDSK